jgi:hypothetical protein
MRGEHANCQILRRSSGARRGKRENVIGGIVVGMFAGTDDDARFRAILSVGELFWRKTVNLRVRLDTY